MKLWKATFLVVLVIWAGFASAASADGFEIQHGGFRYDRVHGDYTQAIKIHSRSDAPLPERLKIALIGVPANVHLKKTVEASVEGADTRNYLFTHPVGKGQTSTLVVLRFAGNGPRPVGHQVLVAKDQTEADKFMQMDLKK
jgi:hypothetical protein